MVLISFSATLLQRRRESVRMSKAEILLMLRAYQQHPTQWNDIIDEIFQNIDQLPAQTAAAYNRLSRKQLKSRLSTKLQKLMANRMIPDPDIRYFPSTVYRIFNLQNHNIVLRVK